MGKENVKCESSIDSYAQLRKLLNIQEKKNYPNSWFDNVSCNQRVYNWRFIKLLRKCEYYRSKTRKLKFRYGWYYTGSREHTKII